MRITTGMLNGSRRLYSPAMYNSSGVSKSKSRSNASNILGRTSGLSRTSGLNTTTAANRLNMANSAETLRSSSEVLASNKAYNVFTNAKLTGSKDGLAEQVKRLTDGYNKTVSALDKEPTELNSSYRRMLEMAVNDNKEALGDIGISIGADKSLSVDMDRFNSASINDIEKVLGSSNSFTTRLNFISGNLSRSSAAEYGRNTGMAYGGYGIGTGYGISSGYGLGSGYGMYSGMGDRSLDRYLASQILGGYGFFA